MEVIPTTSIIFICSGKGWEFVVCTFSSSETGWLCNQFQWHTKCNRQLIRILKISLIFLSDECSSEYINTFGSRYNYF